MLSVYVILLVSLVVLVWSADIFVDGAVALASYYHMPKILIGTVLVGFLTAIPELIVSLDASVYGAKGIAIGNALGSYIINIALVLGITAIVCPIKISKGILQRELPFMTISLLVAFILMADGVLSMLDGYILLLLLLFTMILVTILIIKNKRSIMVVDNIVKITPLQSWLLLAFGMTLMVISSRFLTDSAVAIAHLWGVSDLIIGLTIIAIGTSLPELAASVAGVMKGEDDIAIGNIIGSNILGMFAVLAMPAIFSPGSIDRVILWRDFGFMAFTTAILYLFCYMFDGNKLILNRKEGVVSILVFLLYVYVLYIFPA